jgi:predicted Rossmann fold flavoprotein
MGEKSFDVTIVGAGPSGLMACEVLAQAGLRVLLIDRKSSPGRKFLLAGRGGLNLTHAEPIEQLLANYGSSADRMADTIRAFPPEAVVSWCRSLGIETFTGSSGRIFPQGMKASPLLRNWLRRLEMLGVVFSSKTCWTDFEPKPTILSLGGASWPEMGSNGAWLHRFEEAGIGVTPFSASNCRQGIDWNAAFAAKHAGQFIKNVRVSHSGVAVDGEIVIAKDGIEGTPIYALAGAIRENPDEPLIIDVKPDLTTENVERRLQQRPTSESFSNRYRKALNLSPAAISLVKEGKTRNPKNIRLKLNGKTDLRRAISSAGGVKWSEIDSHYRLKKYPHIQVIGEMIDWDAPTGGYLLQACLSMGYYAAKMHLAFMHPQELLQRPSIQP